MPGDATKVLVVGPAKCGKSIISNFLSGHTAELSPNVYQPTAGTRILEFDCKLTGQAARSWGGATLPLELWDCSGDTKYENCWPAIQRNGVGVLIVYNPENPAHVIEMENFYEWFPKAMGLQDDQVVVCAFRGQGRGIANNDVPRSMKAVEFFQADLDTNEEVSRCFQDLLAGVGKCVG